MAFKLATLFTELTIKDKGHKIGLEKARSGMMGYVKYAGLATSAALAAAAAIAAVTYASWRMVKMAGEQEAVEKRLEQALKSSGHAAGFTAEELIKEANALQQVTKYADDTIVGVQALLATFTNIRGDHFKEATVAVLDLATTMGIGAREAAIQLGKALNDPILGITAMSRSGVSFTQTEKDMIKQLVKTNKLVKAQRVIFEALANQGMRDAATAEGKTFIGVLAQIENAVGDIGEEIGMAMLPAIKEFAKWVKEVLPDIQAWIKENKELFKSIAEITTAIAKFTAGRTGVAIKHTISTHTPESAIATMATSPVQATLGLMLNALLGIGSDTRHMQQRTPVELTK